MRLNRDTMVAIMSLLLCGVMFTATFYLPEPMFGQVSSALWPRVILVPLALLSLLLLVQAQLAHEPGVEAAASLRDRLLYYRYPIICFFLFFLFLITMPVLGMLIGGLLYVFMTLNVLGGWRPKQLLYHGLISAFFVIGMWTIFTQMLGVFLPEGEILRVF